MLNAHRFGVFAWPRTLAAARQESLLQHTGRRGAHFAVTPPTRPLAPASAGKIVCRTLKIPINAAIIASYKNSNMLCADQREEAMRLDVRFAATVLSLLAFFGGCSGALAQADCKALVKASPFGPDDETGATNRVTPAVTKAAAAEIQTGTVTPMAYNLVDGVPLFGTRFTKTILTSFAVVPGAEYGKNKLSYMEDTYLSQSHVGTHIDGLGHIGIRDCYYNQTPMGKYVTQNYLKKLGLEHIKTFATRGVIIDLVKVFQDAGKLKTNPACKGPCLDGGTVITEADIQAGLKTYDVSLREGDAVFLHTGWGDLFNQFPAQNALYNKSEPGLSKSAAQWLADQKVVLVGADTWAVEVIPSEDTTEAFPVHAVLLTDNGIHIVENVRTDLIVAQAANIKRSTFFLSMTVPKAVGTTGTFVNIEAIQ
jgi:kynurenine formamidase